MYRMALQLHTRSLVSKLIDQWKTFWWSHDSRHEIYAYLQKWNKKPKKILKKKKISNDFMPCIFMRVYKLCPKSCYYSNIIHDQ